MNNSNVHIPEHLIPGKDTILYLAISGGVDSVVLLHLLSELGNPIHLLHVNYHLRGDDSIADELLVRKLARKYNVNITVLDFDMQQHLNENGGNLQNEARNIRYSFFKKYLGQNGLLLTAHHLDDQIETFFMHLSRKSGIAGMSCMSERNGNHVRPLLNFRKTELYDFATENKIEYREDVSNQENKYLRNQWRNVWIPEMEKEVSHLADSVQIVVARFQAERKRLEEKYQSDLDTLAATKRWHFTSFDEMCTEGKHLVARNYGIRPSELEELNQLRTAGKSKRLEIKRDELVIWNDGNSFVFDKQIATETPQLKIETVDALPSKFDKNFVYLDEDKLSGKLNIRRWKEGDRIASLGMKGSQLVSDIIKDAKVEVHRKAHVFVVEDAKSIVWVVGLKVGRNAIGGEETKSILKVTVS